ncbi:MAG: NifB/NifX family molybdenum-iron cluster-binding protein [Chitinivibrionales bacterium]|nr:NifB/NifX family molybdenum-iron cluster-binding protein [Chitinivibrionales bacterium]
MKEQRNKSNYTFNETQKGTIMKIAIPTADNKLCMHFGHCQQFVIMNVDEATKTIVSKEELTPPPHEPGVLPQWLHSLGVNVIIAGGMGSRAQQFFQQFGIKVVVGASSDHPQTVALDWLKGSLTTGNNCCDH